MPMPSPAAPSVLDRPDILMCLFHPRPEWGASSTDASHTRNLLIPVAENVAVGARFHLFDPDQPNLLFFHGNGEIVSDYDELSYFYKEIGLNFLPVDYRGYGRSSGDPSVSAMMQDAHAIFLFTRDWLKENGFGGPLLVMGRSLGSASAIDVAAGHAGDIAGLVVESGFADPLPLLERLGADVTTLRTADARPLQNIDKIKRLTLPLLVIHAADDQIIPYSDGEALYGACPGRRKTLVRIPGAGHNTIFQVGIEQYFSAIRMFIKTLTDDGT